MWEHEQPFRLTGDYAVELARDAMDLGPDWLRMVRSFDVPPEALLLRRMENLVFSVLCDLRAAADCHAVGDELRAGLEPRTELGREHAQWRARPLAQPPRWRQRLRILGRSPGRSGRRLRPYADPRSSRSARAR